MWKIVRSEMFSKELEEYLSDGYEPFAVTTGYPHQAIVWLKIEVNPTCPLITYSEKPDDK